MTFDFNKLITYKNKEEAKINKKYYFLPWIELEDMDEIERNDPSELTDISTIHHDCFYDGNSTRYPFIYPAE